MLDPFCGAGTTVLAARMLGLSVTGVDSSPVAVAVAQAKLTAVAPEAVFERAQDILRSSTDTPEPPAGPFWESCYTPGVLRGLCRFRTHFMRNPEPPADRVLCAILLGLVHGPKDARVPFLSNQLPASFAPAPETATAWWRRRGLTAPDIDILEAVRTRAAQVLTGQPASGRGRVRLGDARRISFDEEETFSRVVTSPPYYGMHSYAAHQWLRLWLLGGPAQPTSEMFAPMAEYSVEQYMAELADVWRNVARACEPGARLRMRFGGIPGVDAPHPLTLIREALLAARAGWKITRRRPVADAPSPARSAMPFVHPAPRPVNEFEICARLEK